MSPPENCLLFFFYLIDLIYCHDHKLLSFVHVSVSFKSFIFSGRFEFGKEVLIGKVSNFNVDMFTLPKPDLY